MSEKHEHGEDNQIKFTLGKGNHSSICGGVTPMGIDVLQSDMDAHSTDSKDPVGVKGEFRQGADTKVRTP